MDDKAIYPGILLRDVAERSKALRILRRPSRCGPLLPLLSGGLSGWIVFTGLHAEPWVTGLLMATCMTALTSMFDNLRLSRRVDALVVLALQQQDELRRAAQDGRPRDTVAEQK